MRRLEGKVAIVTGSARGTGRTIAEVFAREGAQVVVTGRSEDKGRRVADRINEAGGDAIFVRCDIGVEDDVRALIDETVDRYGKLTTLVNSAAPVEEVGKWNVPITDVTNEMWDRVLLVGLTGLFWTIKHALPHLVAAGSSSIVNISSGAAVLGHPGTSVYAATKAGMHGLTRAVAMDFGRKGVRCNALVLGRIIVPGYPFYPPADMDAGNAVMTPRLGKPEDVAYAAAWLASDEGEFITGALIPVDGGLTANNFRYHRPD